MSIFQSPAMPPEPTKNLISVRALVVMASLAVSILVVASSGEAIAANAGRHPMLRQITRITTGSIAPPKVRLEQAETIVFASDADVLGLGTETAQREIYLYDNFATSLRRLTDSGSGESYAPSRQTDITHSGRPKYVAFFSTGNLDPSVGNPEQNPEIFIILTDSGEIQQITKTGAGIVNAEPYSSDGGQCLVWRSNGDLDDNDGSDSGNPGAGNSNADGSDEIFMMRFEDTALTDRMTTQVSNGPAGTTSSNPLIGGYWFPRQCRSTIFQSDHDQLGNGSVGSHIYDYTKISGVLDQVTPVGSTGHNVNPAMSAASNFARGPFVVYESDANPLGNPQTGIEIFRRRLFKYELLQLTYQLPGDSFTPVVSDGGGYVAFSSSSELLDASRTVRGGGAPPFNADGNFEIFRTKGRKQIWQITDSSGCENYAPSLQDNGKTIAFLSTCDLIPGLNPNGMPQIFVYSETKSTDPQLAACDVLQGCCSASNGCYQARLGGQVRAPDNRTNFPPVLP
jgi:hypothetical protein